MSRVHEITIERFQDFGGLLGPSKGHGVFVDCGSHRIGVGSILPLPDGRYVLNLTIVSEMQVQGYKPFDFSSFYYTVESAVDAARTFLASQCDAS